LWRLSASVVEEAPRECYNSSIGGKMEPTMEVLEKYFMEVIEGRSLNSVLKALRQKGYKISEGTLRARYQVWYALHTAKKEFEIKLNQLKGELLKKLEGSMEQIGSLSNIVYDNQYILKVLIGDKYEKLIAFGEEYLGPPLLNDLENRLSKADRQLQEQINYLIQENQALKRQISLLAYILNVVLNGIYKKEKESGLFSKKDLWDLLAESGLQQIHINELQKLIRS